MPPVDQDSDLATLTRLRVLDLDQTKQSHRLRLLWRYYEQTQNDALKHDFDGVNRSAGISYLEQRLRSLGWISVENATNPAGPPAAVSFSSRRPSCPTTIVGYIVDTYTAMLLGDGREPAVRVVGDQDSTAALNAMLEAGYAWDAWQEARRYAGAQGAAGFLTEILDGALVFRALRPEDLYIEWETTKDWVPRLVIEQRRVEVTQISDEGKIETVEVWRTRAWDRVHAYVYEDVPIDHGAGTPSGGTSQRAAAANAHGEIELSEAPIPHRAGRCPVIWLQNTRNSDDPFGEPDCPPSVLELVDQLDTLWSMNVRGTKANLDPTLVISDKLVERRWQERRAKGYGQKIEVSEVGSASLLEMTGKTIEVGWLTAGHLRSAIEQRTGVVVIQPDQAGAFATSGVAIQLLRGTANNRAAARRPSLGRAIMQGCQVLLTLASEHRIKRIGDPGVGIALPPREVPSAEQGGEATYVEHEIGSGKAIALSWGDLYSPTPQDLQVTSQALMMATGNQPVLSQATAVGLMINTAQTDTDASEEIKRIQSEAATRVASFESSMRPEADAELEEVLDGADKPAEPGPQAQADDVQATALNGAQVTAFLELMADTGVRIAPEVSARFQARAFQIPVDEAQANVADQVKFLATKPASEAAPDPKSAKREPAAPAPVEDEPSGDVEGEADED